MTNRARNWWTSNMFYHKIHYFLYKKLIMNLLKIGWNCFLCVFQLNGFAFRQCQLAHLLWKMRTVALLSLLHRHDFAMFVSCFFLYCQDLLQLYSVFSSILFGNGLIAHIFFFCHHLPISQFLLLIHFLISWVFVIKYILQEKLSVLYSWGLSFLKYVCFYLHDTMPGKIFLVLISLLQNSVSHFFISSLALGTAVEKSVMATFLFFFSLYMIWSLPLKIFQAQQVNQKFPWGWDFLI